MNLFIQIVGHGTVILSSIILLGLLAIAAALTANRASHAVVEAYGGIKVLRKFRKWYHENEEQIKKELAAAEAKN
jgi:hypothetical protein